MEVKYDNIKNLIKNVDISGAVVKIQFQASNQETPLEGIGTIKIEEKSILKDTAKTAAKTSVISGIISFFASLLGRSVGGAAGSAVGHAARSTGNAVAREKMKGDGNTMSTPTITEKKKEMATVEAFITLQDFYVWDEKETSWLFK